MREQPVEKTRWKRGGAVLVPEDDDDDDGGGASPLKVGGISLVGHCCSGRRSISKVVVFLMFRLANSLVRIVKVFLQFAFRVKLLSGEMLDGERRMLLLLLESVTPQWNNGITPTKETINAANRQTPTLVLLVRKRKRVDDDGARTGTVPWCRGVASGSVGGGCTFFAGDSVSPASPFAVLLLLG
jgi:hypothetical protein